MRTAPSPTPLKAAAAILLGHEVWEMNGEHGFDREAILPEWGFSTREFFCRSSAPNACATRYAKTFGCFGTCRTDCRVLTRPSSPGCALLKNEAALVRSMGGKILEIWRPGVTQQRPREQPIHCARLSSGQPRHTDGIVGTRGCARVN